MAGKYSEEETEPGSAASPQDEPVNLLTNPPSMVVDGLLADAVEIPDLDLRSIVNVEEIQAIMDDFYQLTHMATAILDVNGNIIEGTGWQDLCTKFHRSNPAAAKLCTESDLYLASHLKPGEYVDYKCKNGLWDVVTPIYVGPRHLGNIYAGQFFYNDEEVDEGFFAKQAETYGFDRAAYLEAFRRIPRYDRATVKHLMSFLIRLATHISKIGMANILLEKEVRERKQAEAALRKREAHLSALIETIPDLVWLKDPDGVFLSCNRKFERFYNTPKADILGKTDYDFVDKELADFFRENDKKAMAGRGPSANEEELVYADDGHRETVETVKTPMYDAEGKLVGVLGIARDITQRKLAEESLRESDRIKNEFFTAAAHELRTPLNGIMGFSELMMTDGLSEEQRKEFLSIVIEKAQHLNDTITDLLNLSRFESGAGLPLNRTIFDVNGVLSGWADQLRQKDFGHCIESRFPKTPVMLHADRDKVLQALGNLVSNAIKFSAPTSRIRLGGEVVDGRYQVSVEDEGRGIPPEQVPRIFDKFYRGNASSTAPGGLGIGLSVARSIVEAHGGQIHVESEPGRGTRIWFSLPLSTDPI